MVVFFRETSGDYLAIDTATNRYYLDTLGPDHFEGRAAAIEGLAGSVCTAGIAREYLCRHCKRVARGDVPHEWRTALGL